MLEAELIPRTKKERFLLSMSEDDFRDKVVRPIFFKQGLSDGRELCGPEEEGKDCIFADTNKLGQVEIYAVQTKKGKLNLASDASQNLTNIVAQIRTALSTRVTLTATKVKVLPSYIVLCSSGRTNKSARDYILEQLSNDPRIKFYDTDDLIPKIDSLYPELWFGIDSDKLPYLRKLKEVLSTSSDSTILADIIALGGKASVVTDDFYVPLRLSFETYKIKTHKGKRVRTPRIEQIPMEGLLKKNKSLFLVLGEAGSGKSTALKRIAYSIANKSVSSDDRIVIPIYLRAVDISESEERLLDICAQETSVLLGSSNVAFQVTDLEQGNVLILVDALDEIGEDLKQVQVLNKIHEFVDEYPKCKVILTSRPYAYLKGLDHLASYDEYRLTNIDFKQAQQIIERTRTGKALPKEAVNEIVRRLQDVHGLELSPLLVAVFVATSDYSRRDIPANITELFKKFTEMMLGRWDSSKGMSQQFHAPLKEHLLNKLAYQMHSRRTIQIQTDECLMMMESELLGIGMQEKDIKILMNEMIHRSGLFRVFEDKLEFKHLILQEYFAGRGMPSGDYITGHIADPWWQRPIIFYFGSKPSDINLLALISKKYKPDTAEKRFQVAITAGLSLQACYLAQAVQKIDVLEWVIEQLSMAKIEMFDDEVVSPLKKFLIYYLYARDAVASDILKLNIDLIQTKMKEKLPEKDRGDVAVFWILSGLIECGALDEVIDKLKEYKPEDPRLLLGLHLGSFMAAHGRVITKEQRQLAEKICEKITPHIGDLRKQLISEFESELLEVQKGEIKALPPPVTKPGVDQVGVVEKSH